MTCVDTFAKEEARMTRSRHGWTKVWVVAGALLLASGTAWGQQVFIYPQRGQSPQQQAQDTGECQAWATQQTGGAMAAPPMASAPPPTASPLRGATRGAAIGAVGGAIGGNAGKGAAIGAATGAMMGGMRRHDQMEQQQAQQAQAQQMQAAQADTYKRALATCLGAKGYSVN
jgi:Glycine-zipper domain